MIANVITMLPGHTQNPLPLEYPATRHPTKAKQQTSQTATVTAIRITCITSRTFAPPCRLPQQSDV